MGTENRPDWVDIVERLTELNNKAFLHIRSAVSLIKVVSTMVSTLDDRVTRIERYLQQDLEAVANGEESVKVGFTEENEEAVARANQMLRDLEEEVDSQ